MSRRRNSHRSRARCEYWRSVTRASGNVRPGVLEKSEIASGFEGACRLGRQHRCTRYVASVAQSDERIHPGYMSLAADQWIDVQFRDPVLVVQGEVACPADDVGEPVEIHRVAAAKAA